VQNGQNQVASTDQPKEIKTELIIIPYDMKTHRYRRIYPPLLHNRITQQQLSTLLDSLENADEHQILSKYHDDMEWVPLIKCSIPFLILALFTFCLGVIFFVVYLDKLYRSGFAARRDLDDYLKEKTSSFRGTLWSLGPQVDDMSLHVLVRIK